MAQSFSCPNCGGTLEYGGTGRTMKCPYCGTTVQVPDGLWQPVEQAQTANQWKKYVIIFLIVTVGLPICFSLLGVIAGVGGTFLAAVMPFLLQLLGR